jgi:hypothetical protein
MRSRLHPVGSARRLARLVVIIALALVPTLGAVGPVAAVSVLELPASQLRITLGRVLAEHAFLTIEAMRTGLDEGDDFAAAGTALEGNTRDLVSAIESIYGADAADAFDELWRAHIAYIVDYTRAVADGDEAAQSRAIDLLQGYSEDFADLLSGVNPKLPHDTVVHLLEDHVNQLEQVAAFAEEDYATAYPAVRETYAHMFAIGDGLATAIIDQFPQKFTGKPQAFGPTVDLAVAMDRLLGEHALLAVLSTRAGLSAAPDLEAAVEALDANTTALAVAVGSIYGADAGEEFADLWASHIDQYLDYVEATRGGDDAAADAAAAALAEYRRDFSAWLAAANPALSASALEELLDHHTAHLLEQVDQYAEDDFEAAYTTTREAYAHMATIGAALVTAIAAQFPDRFPDTAIGPAAASEARMAGARVLLALLAIAGIMTLGSMRLRRSIRTRRLQSG